MKKMTIKFRTKLFITYLTLVSFPLLFLGYFSYQQYVESIEKNVGGYVPALLTQSNFNMDKYMSELYAAPDVIARSNEVMAILRKKQSGSTSSSEQDAFFVQSYLANNIVNGRHQDVIAVFVQSGKRVFSSSRLSYVGSAFLQEKNPFQQEMDLQGKPWFLPPGQQKLVFQDNPNYISIYKQIYDADNMNPLCTVLLIVNLSEISKICDQIPFSTNGMLFITNKLGQIVYHNDKNLIGKSTWESSALPLENGTVVREVNHTRMLVSANHSNYTDWTLVTINPIKELTKETIWIRNVTIAVFSICLIVVVIVSAFVSQTVTSPIRTLQRLMRKVEKGNFDVSFPIHQKDEIGELGYSFNHMVQRIQELVQKVYQVEIRQREAELAALQNQISPHFLYNTLESIQMVIEGEDQEKATSMISALSRMLRFAAKRGDIVQIGDEIKHVSDYLYIQQLRYGSRCSYDIDVSPGMELYYAPKFTLQPLVENSIRHVVEKSNAPTDIRIEITGVDLGVQMIISDNGAGIPEESLQILRERLADTSQAHSNGGIGLINVHSRIRFMYGSDYGIQIESLIGKGTKIYVLIPYLLFP
ncbi:sensor histidine kinase [Paenibacillus planticolens]|uniref:histidine kinase n=1 Tax=Paenibacillus planticolens TaxID=2654976 RepID=A0ABX1ZV80_9BACL|nr:sensor histidine kinase [Paenibacillus planticolens]NOV03954.1 HAMP domain-containing protein [Paenibacillus planticolens]